MSPFTSENMRYEYPLSPDSMVIDAGGYHGSWALEIYRRYGSTVHVFEPVYYRQCRAAFGGIEDKVKLYCLGLGGVDREVVFGVAQDSTGQFAQSKEQVAVPVISVRAFWSKIGLGQVDLMKLNVEGMEYEIIDSLLETGLIHAVENLQVQFHGAGGRAGEIDSLVKRLYKTHKLEWGGDWFLWSSFGKHHDFVSYSQAGQDVFAKRVLGKKTGTFLDIGSSHPVNLSNTYGLERSGWRGVMVDNDSGCLDLVKRYRKSKFVLGDATQQDYVALCGNQVDYLSLDVDFATLSVLRSIPLDRIKFGVITIEHDRYRFGDGPRNDMRDILRKAGYVMIAEDVCHGGCQFEDWWVHPDYRDAASFARSAGLDWSEIVR